MKLIFYLFVAVIVVLVCRSDHARVLSQEPSIVQANSGISESWKNNLSEADVKRGALIEDHHRLLIRSLTLNNLLDEASLIRAVLTLRVNLLSFLFCE